jgi:DNA-binding LacI/PurR family transcriptional regulator
MSTREPARRITARDVAMEVGCSVSSVSLVVSGKAEGRVRQETQDAIHAAIARLGYRLNTTASALASGTALGVGFLSPDPTNPFFSMVLDGLGDALADRYALSVLVPTGGADYDRGTVRRALAGDFAGLILASPSERLLDDFVPTCPTILLDAGGPVNGLASIDVDLTDALAELAAHLTDLGHRRIAYLGFRREKASVQGRRHQLATALQQRGAVLDPTTVELTELTESAAEAAFAGTWPVWRANGVTAIVCGDELFAYGVLRSCRAQGISVPGDLSLVGFDNLPYSSLIDPPLTSVDLSARELGRTAGEALLDLVSTGRSPVSSRVAATLVVRSSTAAPASARNPQTSAR